DRRRIGKFEQCDHGTIFLDEVGDMPLPTQAKILRLLQERRFERIGGNDSLSVDVRIIAATNKDLGERTKGGSFREDLYYRLNVMPIKIPPLRERPEDIPMLVEFFLFDSAGNINSKVSSIDEDALKALRAYGWPGNIRELRNVLERAVILCQGQVITTGLLTLPAGAPQDKAEPLTLSEMERIHIRNVLASSGDNRTRAAKLLGISRSTLNEKIKTYQLA
ncbi:MAG TPA: sigma 54-interacting transcriptional regulator, partial [Thermodesulfovibrionales bacterium]|nr:sigma 54-interacting transcriptional regulator [Thermodesulfovibrionales bacterium]